MTTTAIVRPLPGERVLELSPDSPAGAAQTWLRRPNLFPGRTLTGETLKARSAWTAGRISQRGQAYLPGVIEGLEIDVRPAYAKRNAPLLLSIGAGRGLCVSGEDVALREEQRIALSALPVVAPPGVLAGADGFGSGALQPRVIGGLESGTLGALLDDHPGLLPWVGVLLLHPVRTDRRDTDPLDPCDRCVCDDDPIAYEDIRLADGARLLWYAWPIDAPGLALPAPGPAFRNRLAWSVFDAERRLPPDAALPWEAFGVPLALVCLPTAQGPLFVDTAAVRRRGGRVRESRLQIATSARLPASPVIGREAATVREADGLARLARTPLPLPVPLPGARTGLLRLAGSERLTALWQAQIEQFAEQVNEAGAAADNPFQLGADFARLPPCGLLPRSAIDLDSGTFGTAFLPPGMLVDVVPIATEQLDLAIRESAALAPFDKQPGERIRLLVPVSQASYEPRLLHRDVIAPEFAETLTRFLRERAHALVARHVMREKAAVLVRALRGSAPVLPGITGDPQATENESLDGIDLPPASGGHRTPVVQGLHRHFIRHGDSTRLLNPADRLFVWVRIDPDHPPRSLGLVWATADGRQSLAWWGEDRITTMGEEEFAQRLQIDALPPATGWQRLVLSVKKLGLGDVALAGISFRIFDGRAAFASAGVIRNGVDQYWLPGLPDKDSPNDAESPFVALAPLELIAPFEPTLGVTVLPGAQAERRSDALHAIGSSPLLASLHEHEKLVLRMRGLEAFLRYLQRMADRADDLVDVGFAKVQADLYRIRQLVLDSSSATRLAVSPSLSGIAKADTAPASSDRIARFFGELSARPKTPPPPPPPPPPAIVYTATPARTAALKYSGLKQQTQIRAISATAAPTLQLREVRALAPLVGSFSIRNVTVAERLKRPPAEEALDYAVATRHEVVSRVRDLLVELTRSDGVQMAGLFDDLTVWRLGIEVELDRRANPNGPLPPASFALRDLVNPETGGPLLARLAKTPLRDNADEGTHFSDASDISDRTIALLRQLEGRIRIYRDLIEDCEEAIDDLRGDLLGIGQRERSWQDALDEARHDVAVTRALIAEEEARIAAVNARRAAVLKEEFRFAAFVRPRAADNLDDAVSRVLDPGLLPAPVPACLAEHDDVPDELREMLVVLREAPARWFGEGPNLVAGLDRLDLLARTVQHAQLRIGVAAQRIPLAAAAPATGLSGSISKVQASQRQVVDAARSAARFDPARLALAGWQAARREAAEVISLGDLIDGDHGRNAVSRSAADFFDRFSRVCGCLHGAFSAVPPSIRLDWAETLSQFDEAPNLRNLAGLARYAELPYAERRRLQGLTDWLFDQIELAEPRATALVNDLLRMCLLLASHAPVGRIIAGRLPRPVTVRPGVRIPLLALDPSRLRIGMQALISRGGQVVARAVVEDLGDGEASARVIHTVAASEALDVTAQVQFADAAALGAGPRTPARRGR